MACVTLFPRPEHAFSRLPNPNESFKEPNKDAQFVCLIQKWQILDEKGGGACLPKKKRGDGANLLARSLALTLSKKEKLNKNPKTGTLKPWSSLPGPRTLPLIGNALEFASMPRGRPQIHRLWQRLANEHGPLYR